MINLKLYYGSAGSGLLALSDWTNRNNVFNASNTNLIELECLELNGGLINPEIRTYSDGSIDYASYGRFKYSVKTRAYTLEEINTLYTQLTLAIRESSKYDMFMYSDNYTRHPTVTFATPDTQDAKRVRITSDIRIENGSQQIISFDMEETRKWV